MFPVRLFYFVLIFCVVQICNARDGRSSPNLKVSQNRISAQILAYLDHYKQNDPVGIPGAKIPDPMSIPDVKQSLGIGTLTMKQVLAHGLSKFRIKNVHSDLKALQVNAKIQLDEMNVSGRYTLVSFVSKAEGPFRILLKNVVVTLKSSLAVNIEGKLHADDIQMDINFSDMALDFQNLGFLGSIFQGFINSAPNLIFDAMKPYILQEAYKRIREELDVEIEKASAGHKFPNSITPLDMAIAEARKYVRAENFDPYFIPDYNHTVGVCTMKMKNTYVIGLSSFYRVGDMTISIDDHIVTIVLQIGTQRIVGSSQWEISLGSEFLSRGGRVQFTVDHIKATIEVSQPMDTRKNPTLKDLQLELGNIQVRCDGAGTLDYVIEFAVNLLPNLLRYQIMDAVENPLRMRIQEKLDQLKMEELIAEQLDALDNQGFESFPSF